MMLTQRTVSTDFHLCLDQLVRDEAESLEFQAGFVPKQLLSVREAIAVKAELNRCPLLPPGGRNRTKLGCAGL